jgi:hypothetical protein
VLHIQPKMIRPNDAHRNKHLKHYSLHMVKKWPSWTSDGIHVLLNNTDERTP